MYKILGFTYKSTRQKRIEDMKYYRQVLKKYLDVNKEYFVSVCFAIIVDTS